LKSNVFSGSTPTVAFQKAGKFVMQEVSEHKTFNLYWNNDVLQLIARLTWWRNKILYTRTLLLAHTGGWTKYDGTLVGCHGCWWYTTVTPLLHHYSTIVTLSWHYYDTIIMTFWQYGLTITTLLWWHTCGLWWTLTVI
jgi:hypothetical protein